MTPPVYLDHQATTPLDPQVFEAMRPYFMEWFGNPSSRLHSYGWRAEEALESARQDVARALGARPTEVVFTSGATESNALAITGTLRAFQVKGSHLITAATEHASVLATCRSLAAEGAELTVLPVDRDGGVDPGELQRALRPNTRLVSVMAANNEIGTLAPIATLCRIVHQHGALFHTDATALLGHLPLQVDDLGCDLLSVSAHKIYGPKGAGALFVRSRGVDRTPVPLFHGGDQERGRRAGTPNVPALVGFGHACRLAVELLPTEPGRQQALRDRLRDELLQRLDGVVLNGPPVVRLPANLNLSFADLDAEALFAGLRDLAVSNGSACHSATREPSHVLLALGRDPALALASIRFSLGRGTTREQIDYALERVVATVTRLRGARPRGGPAASTYTNRLALGA